MILDKIFIFFYYSVLIFLGTIYLSSPAHSDVPRDNIMDLSLEEGILMVLKNNLDIAIQQTNPHIESWRVFTEQGVFDPVLSGSFRREDADTPLSTRSSVAAGGRSSVESEVYSLSTGLTGRLPTGTQYTLEFENIWTENTFNSFNAEYDVFAGISITQPILKNSGSSVNKFNIIIARKNHELSINDLRQNVINTLSSFKKTYWDLVLAYEDLTVKKESLKLAQSLLDLNRKRLKAEVTSPLEVTQAEAGVASRKEELIVAEHHMREQENALKKLITNDVYPLRNTRIIPSNKPVISQFTFDLEASFRQGILHRPDYSKARTEIDKNAITVKYEKRQKLPNIDIEASYGFNGLGNSFSDSVDNMNNNNEWSLGMFVRIPLGNREARGKLGIAQLEARQGLLNLKKLEQEIFIEIDNALRNVETSLQRIEAAAVSKRLAEESLQAEEIKLKEGLSTSHDVLQFQEDLVEARSREIIAVIDYNKSLVELSRVKGTMLREEGIMLSNDSLNLVRR